MHFYLVLVCVPPPPAHDCMRACVFIQRLAPYFCSIAVLFLLVLFEKISCCASVKRLMELREQKICLPKKIRIGFSNFQSIVTWRGVDRSNCFWSRKNLFFLLKNYVFPREKIMKGNRFLAKPERTQTKIIKKNK